MNCEHFHTGFVFHFCLIILPDDTASELAKSKCNSPEANHNIDHKSHAPNHLPVQSAKE